MLKILKNQLHQLLIISCKVDLNLTCLHLVGFHD